MTFYIPKNNITITENKILSKIEIVEFSLVSPFRKFKFIVLFS